MIKKLTDEIRQVKIPISMNMGDVNCYVMKGANGYTIIDTGCHTEEAKARWTNILSDGTPVEKVVVTHAHPDHGGLAGWFQQQFHAPVWISKRSYTEMQKTRSFILNPNENPIFSFLRAHGGPEIPVHAQRRLEDYDFEPDVLFDDCSQIQLGDYPFACMWTPGHSPDHYCFFNEREQLLFIGDHVLQSINTIVLSEQPADNSLHDYFLSLNRIEGCAAKWVMPGHGELIDNLSERIVKMKAHYGRRWQQMQDFIQEEGSTAYEISQRVYGIRQITDRASSAPFLQTITNLIYLESIGRIRKEERLGIVYYFSIPL